MNSTSSALRRTDVACPKRSAKRCWGRPDNRPAFVGLVADRRLTPALPLPELRDSLSFVSLSSLMIHYSDYILFYRAGCSSTMQHRMQFPGGSCKTSSGYRLGCRLKLSLMRNSERRP